MLRSLHSRGARGAVAYGVAQALEHDLQHLLGEPGAGGELGVYPENRCSRRRNFAFAGARCDFDERADVSPYAVVLASHGALQPLELLERGLDFAPSQELATRFEPQ